MSDGAPTPAAATALVGREQELGRIERSLSDVPDGPTALTIVGEAGIGKTALWRDGLARARDRGYRVLVSRPGEEEMPLSGVGLVDLFEGDEPVDGADEGNGPPATGREVLHRIRALADDTPTIVAIDDVQWLDSVSARTLRFALRRLQAEPVALFTTRRREAARPDPLPMTGSIPVDRLSAIELGPLDIEDIRRVIGEVLTTVPRPTLRRIYEVSGGNPLYALELARTVRAKGAAGSLAGTLPMPDSIQRAIGDRLDAHADLGPLLAVVASVGPTSATDLRGGLVDDADRLLSLAQDAGLVVVDEDLSVRFSHPLIGSAVYATIDPLSRRDLHGRLAEVATDPDVRARHVALSAEAPDGVAADLLEVAATRAMGRGASDLAAGFVAHSVRLTPPEDERSRRRRQLQQIEYLAASGEAGGALELADDLRSSLPHGPERAAVLVQRFKVEDDDLGFGQRLLEEALDDAGSDRLLRGHVLDMLAWLHGMLRGDLVEGIACAREAVGIAASLGDPPLRMLSLSSQALMEALTGQQREDLMGEAVELERELGSRGTSEGPLALAGRMRFWAGELSTARSLFLEAVQAGAREGNELTRPYRLYDLALLESAEGRFEEARELARQGLEAAEDAHFPPGSLHYPNAVAAMWLGETTEARASAETLRSWAEPRGERTAVVRAMLVEGQILLSEGDAASATTPLLESAELLHEIGIGEPGAFPVLPEAIEAAALSGDLDRADILLDRLEAQRRAVQTVWAAAAVERSRGVILAARGEHEAAASSLEEVAETFEGLGFLPESARAIHLRGLALLRGGQRTAAADAFATARVRFDGMHAPSWASRAAEELERAAPGRATGRLTKTERRIAELVAAGKKNRQIAESMFVSVATVEAHLTRIYRKLGIRSRAELTRLVTAGEVDT